MARRPGFTLVELMVSLAILAVLFAALVPLVGRARAAALKVVCTSRLRDLTFACNQYFHENGVYPLQPGTTVGSIPGVSRSSQLLPTSSLTPPKPTDMDPGFLNLLAKYIRFPTIDPKAPASDLPHVVQCPTMEDAPDEPRIRFADLTYTRPTLYTGYGYCVRPKDSSLALGITLLRPERVAPMKRPSNAVVWADDVHWSARDYAWGFAHAVPRAQPGRALLSYAQPAGLLGQHVARGDGSVEWIPGSEIDLDVAKNNTRNPVASLSVFGNYFYWF